MLKLTPEAKVGLFVFIGIILLAYMSMRVGGFTFGGDEGYTLNVKLKNAGGLDQNASVQVAGVEVGRIKEIMLDNYKAKIILQMKPGIKIGRDFTAVLTTKGLLGEKYLELIPGSPDSPFLEEGDEITRVLTYTDMDKLLTVLSDVATDVKQVTASLASVLGGDEGETTLRNIVTNIESITEKANSIMARNDEKLSNVVDNLEEFTRVLREETPGIASSLKQVADNLNSVIEENRGDIRAGVESLRVASVRLEETMETVNRIAPEVESTISSIGSVAEKIDRGEGTIGKLVNEDSLYRNLDKTVAGINRYIEKGESFRTYLSFRAEHLFDAEEAKTYFSIRIQPKSDKYYLFEIIDDPRGHRSTKDIIWEVDGDVTTRVEETRTSDKVEFSAQIAKRFQDVTVRGGIIESSGGAGVDYHLLDDRLKFTFEAFDFDREHNPHLKLGFTYFFNKYFFVTAGADDFISRVGLESAYVGLGFEFEDEDLKYLLTSAPPISF
ncbi:MAG: MlaD family protein [Thermodesulfobacteriota bacterium]